MVKINERLYELQREDLFSKVIQRINSYKRENPDRKLLSLGIGDVSKPVIRPIRDAMHKAVDDLGEMTTFKGYGAYTGYNFLKEKILENDYKGFNFTTDEVYISCGTKTDSTSILELFDIDAKICITNPMYPVYKDGATCLNRNVIELELSGNTGFVSDIPDEKYDLMYICSPNNPIGIAYTYKQLKKFVDYAIENECVILYDNVYEDFITSDDVPHSIYEIEGSEKCAIEFRSYSKTAGFTGVRCSYYIIPNDIHKDINILWRERTVNRYNGTDYIAQRGAEAVYLEESQKLIKNNIKEYSDNALYLRKAFLNLGFEVWGGIDCPFMWIKTKDGMDCWDFFDIMLKKLNVIIIPGSIFGSFGDKYFRVSGLGLMENSKEIVRRLNEYYEKEV